MLGPFRSVHVCVRVRTYLRTTGPGGRIREYETSDKSDVSGRREIGTMTSSVRRDGEVRRGT